VAGFLSGGIDSSTIVALAHRHGDIKTFCVSFEDTKFDEAPYARAVADYLGTDHHEVSIRLSPADLVHQAIGFFDEPFADSSALPTFAVCAATRDFCKVVLSGDGGDEVFGGYTGRYRTAALSAVVPLPGILSSFINQLPPWRSGKRSSLPEMLKVSALPSNVRYLSDRQITDSDQRCALFGHDFASRYEPTLLRISEEAMVGMELRNPVTRALWQDLRTSLADDMLTKVDRMSMAHGLEVRIPFLDHHLVEFALSIPAKWLVSPLPVEGKRLLRDVARLLLPEVIFDRPKHGFVVPLNKWLKDHLLEIFDDLCMGADCRISNWMAIEEVKRLRNLPLADRPRQDLYALLVLEMWLRRLGV
jgi:asparagine synthase (glutamine-hydrolysing)